MLKCVYMIEDKDFTLDHIYRFEELLARKHPDNHNVKDKIRQQLQMLRDNGITEFTGRGHYRKIINNKKKYSSNIFIKYLWISLLIHSISPSL